MVAALVWMTTMFWRFPVMMERWTRCSEMR
jgi:hypothetical protein